MIRRIFTGLVLYLTLASVVAIAPPCVEAGFPYSMTHSPSTGNTILADHINTSNNEHINNNIPESIDDYSVSDAEMQSTADPYPSGVISRPITLDGELQRLRNQIFEIQKALGTGFTYWYEDVNYILKHNVLINGVMQVSQRGSSFTSATTPANNNDTYLVDRWILLSALNDSVDVTTQTGGGVSGNAPYIRLDVETVSKKFGILQIIETKNEKHIRGSSVSLSFEARVSDVTKLTDIRAVVLAWTSTADVVTSGIISTWNAEGTRPTLVANWTAENTDSDLGVTASWARYEIQNISLNEAATANVAVFIYQNDVATNDTLGTLLEITNVQLVPGQVATKFEQIDYGTDLTKCKRYYEELNNEGLGTYQFGSGQCKTTTTASIPVSYEVEKRATPTVTVSAAGDFGVWRANSVQEAVTVFAFNHESKTGFRADITVAANLLVGDATLLEDDTNTNARIYIDAEL